MHVVVLRFTSFDVPVRMFQEKQKAISYANKHSGEMSKRFLKKNVALRHLGDDTAVSVAIATFSPKDGNIIDYEVIRDIE